MNGFIICIAGIAVINWIMYAIQLSHTSLAAAGFVTGLLFSMVYAEWFG